MNNFDFVTNYGSTGTGNTNLDTPLGIDTDGEFLYIVDQGNDRILKWTLCGGLFVAKNGSNGSGDDNFDTPQDILYHNDRLFVVDSANFRIKIHRASDLGFIGEFGQSGSSDEDFSTPTGITTDGLFLYILDGGNNRVVKHDLRLIKNGASAASFVNKISLTVGDFNGIAYDKDEKVIYIADSTNETIEKISVPEFISRDTITTSDSTDSAFTSLSGVAVKDHYVYVLEGDRIQVFDAATLTTRTTGGSSGSGNSNITLGGRIIACRSVVMFSDQTLDRINVWVNYDPGRAIDSLDTKVIIGDWFVNPIIPIGGTQEEANVTIGGTATTDKFLNIEEEELTDNFANVEET